MKHLLCWLGRHDYYRIRALLSETELMGCRRCGRYWGMHHGLQALLPFDQEMYDMYVSIGVEGLEYYLPKGKAA